MPAKTMKKPRKPIPDDKEQSQRFVETAKMLEIDESGKSFERALKVTIKHSPKPSLSKSLAKKAN